MEEEVKDLILKIEDVQHEIYDYILNTEHYIFYWINDKEVQEFIRAYPLDYEDRLRIIVMDASSDPKIRICFEDHPDEFLIYIERLTDLKNFRDLTKARWLKWNGKVNDMQKIVKLEQEIKFFRERLETAEKELDELKNITF